MSNLSADKVLRVNCPGFGISSTLPLGEAKPLAMYDVIVINPVSIVHLFEPKSDVAKQIDRTIADGSSTLTLDSDSTLESISAELELREHELRQFLAKGGLLIYFLAAPFVVQGPEQAMDNYIWLYEWAPDQLMNSERTISASKGRGSELTTRGKHHPFGPYLQQMGIEWSAAIKSERLTEGYNLIGTSGGKGVAGYKSSGPKRGQVLFLPAPYDTRYDDTLKDCILKWYEIHTGPEADKPEPNYEEQVNAFDSEPDIEGEALMNDLFEDTGSGGVSLGGAKKKSSIDWPEFDNDVPPFAKKEMHDELDAKLDALDPKGGKTFSKDQLEDSSPFGKREMHDELDAKLDALDPKGGKTFSRDQLEQPTQARPPADEDLFESKKSAPPVADDGFEERRPKVEDQRFEQEVKKPKASQDEDFDLDSMLEAKPKRAAEPAQASLEMHAEKVSIPEAKDLMSRMEHELSVPGGAPEWCGKVSFSELADMQQQLDHLNETVRKAKIKITDIEERIRKLGEIKDALLSATGHKLHNSCAKVFELLGWTAEGSLDESKEMYLKDGDKVQAIVRIIYSTGQPNRSELAELSQSVISYWDRTDVEPKGILLASTYADRHPREREEEDFTASIQEFARRKNLCLINALQLLAMYREVALRDGDAARIREGILTTSGPLNGFRLQFSEPAAARS